MMRNILHGVIAGAAGTVALNIVTYLEMTVRGRPASQVPAQVVDTAASRAGVPLGAESEDEETIENRKSGLGALTGYDAGLGVGALYGVVRPVMSGLPRPVAGAGVGAAAMLASDVPAALLNVTNPREWDVKSWASDVVPHLAYGMVTAFVMDELRGN